MLFHKTTIDRFTQNSIYNKGMAESTGTSLYNAKNFLHPIEGGIVNKFDKLFEEREKKLKDWIARAIINKQEFLTRTFPNLITIGAEHPQLSGGVLYMMGLISPHIHGGSEAVNSIPRRFAERMSTQKDAAASHKLAEIHTKQESILRIHPDAIFPKPETGGNPLINREMKRTEITRQLYAFKKRFVEIQYEKDGKKIDLGANGCLTSTLNPESKTGKTMVFICSSGGEPPGVESFAVEYAMRTGDKVIIVGMPDAHSGTITKEFAQVVKNDAKPPLVDLKRTFKTPTYEAHTQFFKRMIASLVADGQQFDLYSHSGGDDCKKSSQHA
jgi:hypothetical protein